jgi:hypothetical protein
MAKSIIQEEKTRCYICGKNASADYFGLDEHHVFFGQNRKASEIYGLKVYLCHDSCHLNGVHQDAKLNRALQSKVQKIAMKHYKWSIEDFRDRFGRNYL